MAVATVSQTDNLEIKISVAERFVSRIKMDQNAFISFNAYPGVEFTAKVVEISPVLDTSTRTMNAKLRLSPNDDRIHVGMYGRVKLITDSVNNVIVVPLGAIVQRDGKPYIFVVSSQKTESEPARVKLQSVSEGITVDSKTEITNGISAGDMIVVKGQSLLNDGSAVNIVSVSE
jgi:RND family efflux transporter MFP subunit